MASEYVFNLSCKLLTKQDIHYPNCILLYDDKRRLLLGPPTGQSSSRRFLWSIVCLSLPSRVWRSNRMLCTVRLRTMAFHNSSCIPPSMLAFAVWKAASPNLCLRSAGFPGNDPEYHLIPAPRAAVAVSLRIGIVPTWKQDFCAYGLYIEHSMHC